MNIKAGTEKNENSIWSRNFTLLFFSNFFLFFGAEMLSPVLPVYMAQNGGNNSQIGIVMGSFTISAIIIRLLAVKLTDYFGKRVFLLVGLLVCALAAGGYYLTAFVLFLFLLRILHGFGFGAATTLYGAIVSNIFPKARIGEGMGFFGLGVALAVAIGPFLGAIIVSFPNYKWIFFLSFGLIVAAMFLTKFSTAGRDQENKGKRSASRFSLSDFLEINAIFPSVLSMIFAISMAGMFTFIVLFGLEIKIKSIGIFFLITSVTEFIFRPVAGKLFDRRGTFPVLVPGALSCTAGTILLSISKDLPMLIAASVFYGIGIGMLFPTLEAWALKSADPDRRVAANATFYNFFDAGIGIGSVILGFIAQATNYATMYLYSSSVFVIFLIVYFLYHFRIIRLSIPE